ncbi:MAG: IclR family transcriptional regulator [Desulfovibrio sp.]|jgi:DNA-binding IclR family transcriptional regulator|nr:IclR family transcriptional regulator [Desulfovibrio sp.]
MGSKYITIQSVSRAMAIMEHLAYTGNDTGITSIANEVALHKSTCFGLLHTLRELGYVFQDEKTGHYSLGIKVFELGQRYMANLDLRRVAQPHLVALSEESLETVHLVFREGLHAVYIDKINGPHAMTISSQVGQRARLYCTGVGKAILANMSPKEIEAALPNVLEPMTKYTITDKKKLVRHLQEIKESALSVDNQEIELGLMCIAAPIFNADCAVAAAISVSAPTTRLSEERVKTLSNSLKEAAKSISRKLGCRDCFLVSTYQGVSAPPNAK